MEVQAARGLQDSLARAAVQDPTTGRKQETSALPDWNQYLNGTASFSEAGVFWRFAQKVFHIRRFLLKLVWPFLLSCKQTTWQNEEKHVGVFTITIFKRLTSRKVGEQSDRLLINIRCEDIYP